MILSAFRFVVDRQHEKLRAFGAGGLEQIEPRSVAVE